MSRRRTLEGFFVRLGLGYRAWFGSCQGCFKSSACKGSCEGFCWGAQRSYDGLVLGISG